MKIKFFSLRSYEENYLLNANEGRHEMSFDQDSLSINNATSVKGFEVISVFTNDDLSEKVLQKIKELGVKYISIRATGYDHVDLNYTSTNGISVANVPEYSPYSVAEHAVMLMLSLNRKMKLASEKVKHFDFRLNDLIGFDMQGKTVGIIGMGRIGAVVARILNGFGCKILAYDLIQNSDLIEKFGVVYCTKEELFEKSDIITLHCPLNASSKYLINKQSIAIMKKGVMIINCGRGGLINTLDAIEGLEEGKIEYLGLDVYEKEKGLFFFDHSKDEVKDPLLLKLMNFNNVLVTPHQAFLTSTALMNIADTTIYNIDCWAKGQKSKNEIVK